MIIYLLKTIVCSGLLWAVYKLLLEKEKMNHFKRFYLLLSLLFSYTIPLLVFTLPQYIHRVTETITSLSPAYLPITVTESYTNQLPANYPVISIMSAVYSIITISLIYRFANNLLWLYKKTKYNRIIYLERIKLILVKEDIVPYSFLHYIFVSESAYNENRIEETIFSHEMTHVRQKHSIDIVVLELLRMICWFNPFLYAYKKSMQLNHEFLADSYVVKTCNDTTAYQYLLLNTISTQSSNPLISQFNFLTTKKRFIMMTKHTSRSAIILKVTGIISVILVIGYFFSTKVSKKVLSTTEGVSRELMDEYKSIFAKYSPVKDPNAVYDFQSMTPTEKNRLETIFFHMSKEQRARQHIGFIPPAKPLPQIIPAKSQLKSWKNAGLYGVWINDKRVKNTVLDKYSNTDFATAFVIKLYGLARRNVRYSYRVSLMTKDHYQQYYDKTTADAGNMMVFMPKAKSDKQ